MADEPNKQMDETLKAYAAKRRQETGAPLELHPATRQMLQAEVARAYKQTREGSWLQRLIAFWPRVAFATACVAITVTLVLVVLPRQRVMEMAQGTAPPAANEPRDLRLSDKEEREKLAAVGDAPAAPAASSTAPLVPPSSLDRLAKQVEGDEFKAKSELMADQRKDADSVRLLREEAVAKDEAKRPVFANNADSVRSRYTQKNVEAQLGVRLQAAKEQQVLSTFELEQKGDAVRVIDGDGSVYVGNILSGDDVKKRSFTVQGQSGAVAGSAAPAAENQLMFYAVGTNLSLRQKVSIEANILQVDTNAFISATPAPAQKPAGVNERSTGQYNRQSATQNAFQNAIRGRARVGTNQEVPIDAISIKP
ncbi:MAG TPA: hypothetical protein VJ063_15820 [Verrucomicrobiae bacterium]|nr:hypothetical protein [Verrucomicrobiae bacterium]